MCGEHIAGNVSVELQPDFVALVVDVPGCVQGTIPSLKKNVGIEIIFFLFLYLIRQNIF